MSATVHSAIAIVTMWKFMVRLKHESVLIKSQFHKKKEKNTKSNKQLYLCKYTLGTYQLTNNEYMNACVHCFLIQQSIPTNPCHISSRLTPHPCGSIGERSKWASEWASERTKEQTNETEEFTVDLLCKWSCLITCPYNL